MVALASAAWPSRRAEPQKGGALFDAGSFGNKKEPSSSPPTRFEYDYKTNVVPVPGDVIAVQARPRCGATRSP